MPFSTCPLIFPSGRPGWGQPQPVPELLCAGGDYLLYLFDRLFMDYRIDNCECWDLFCLAWVICEVTSRIIYIYIYKRNYGARGVA